MAADADAGEILAYDWQRAQQGSSLHFTIIASRDREYYAVVGELDKCTNIGIARLIVGVVFDRDEAVLANGRGRNRDHGRN